MADPAASGGAFLSSSAIFDAAGGARRNLIVEGRIDAQVPLHAHGVAVASSGRVRGDIHAAMIRVEGEVVGDLFGAVQVRVCYLASVKGDITAPNVIVEEGARFEGQVVMAEPEPLAAPELGGESRVIVNA